MATDTSTETEAKAARKAGTVAFGGQIDLRPHRPGARACARHTAAPRRDHDLVAPTVHLSPLSHIQAAKQLKPAFSDWSPEHYTRLQALYPEGVPADAIDAAAQRCAPPWRRLLSTVHRAHRARRLGKQMRQQLKLKRILPALGVSQSQLRSPSNSARRRSPNL